MMKNRSLVFLQAFKALLFLSIFSGQMLQAQDTTMAAVRKVVSGSILRQTFITDPGREGRFIADPTDRTSLDDSVMVLVTQDGVRLKRATDQYMLNVRWFGAKGNGADDWWAIQKGINYILNHPESPRVLYFPAGSYRISAPLIIARPNGSAYQQSAITLCGPANSRTIAAGFAQILPNFTNSFVIGIQSGKGVLIKDLSISGKFLLPRTLTPISVDTLSFKQWSDPAIRDNPLSPYAAIVVDPFSDSTVYTRSDDMYPGLHRYYLRGMNRGGSTNVQIVGCSITNFIVGVMITPSNQQNGELIDVIDCDISYTRVAYAMGQAQSKECHVIRLKCWGQTHTIFDNVNFGIRHGDGAAVPMVDGVNVAGAVKQLCNIQARSFGGVFRNVYGESLFRLGYVGGAATVAFDNCQFDFSSQDPGVPYPDFYVLGSGTVFHDCIIRLYPGVPGARLLFSGTNDHFDGGTTNAPPITINLDNNGMYPNPTFSNVGMYYSGGILGSSNYNIVSKASPLRGSNGNGTDPVYYGNTYWFRESSEGTNVTYKFTYKTGYERTASLSGTPVIHALRSNWTAWFKLTRASDANLLEPGDFILTSGLSYQDQFQNFKASTYPVGIIQAVRGDTVELANLALGIEDGKPLQLWMDYFVMAIPPFTGDMMTGSNTLTHVQGDFPAVGTRLDMPMLPVGTFVTQINPAEKTIRFSNANNTGQSFAHYTCVNGNPSIEIYAHTTPENLIKTHKTLFGGAELFESDIIEYNDYGRDDLVNGALFTKYRIYNTNIKGDTSLHPLKYTLESAASH